MGDPPDQLFSHWVFFFRLMFGGSSIESFTKAQSHRAVDRKKWCPLDPHNWARLGSPGHHQFWSNQWRKKNKMAVLLGNILKSDPHQLTLSLTYIRIHYIWHSISHILWHSIWHSLRHIFWHSIWHSVWHSIWHMFWHSIWHSLWHSIWHIFWHSVWHSIWHSV